MWNRGPMGVLATNRPTLGTILLVAVLTGAPAFASDAVNELTQACFRGALEKVQQLLDAGVDVNGMNQAGDTPLAAAVRMRRTAVIELLLRQGADPNGKDAFGDPPLVVVTRTWGDIPTMSLLLDAGADANLEGQMRNTPLVVAARAGLTEAAAFLVSRGADVNKAGDLRTTPLIAACTTALPGRTALVGILLDHRADPTLRDQFGFTAMDAARRNRNEELLKFLMERGVKE